MEFCLSHLIWQYLSIRDIINLSLLAPQYTNIINDSHTWNFLLRRDFNISSRYSQINPYKEYGKQLLNQLSDLFIEHGNVNYKLSLARPRDNHYFSFSHT